MYKRQEYTLTPATFTHEVGDDLLCQFKRYDGRTQLLVITCARGRFATLVDTPVSYTHLSLQISSLFSELLAGPQVLHWHANFGLGISPFNRFS